MTRLVLELKKIKNDNKTLYNIFHSISEAETIINENDIDDVFESIYSTIISNTQKYIEKISGLMIDSVIHHDNIFKYNSLPGSSYIKLPKELDHPRKGLINVQNIDDHECFI